MKRKIEISNVFIERRYWNDRRAVCFDFRVVSPGDVPEKRECLEWLTDDLQMVAVSEGNVIGCVEDGWLDEEEVLYVRDRLNEHLDLILGSLRPKVAASVIEAAE